MPRQTIQWVLLLAASIVSVALVGPSAQNSRAQNSPSVDDLMTAKLNAAQRALEALATEDFGQMAENSQKLSLLSRDASWSVLQTQLYSQCSENFRRAADAMTAAAKKKNTDAAALAYVQMTLSCVECHKHVRAVRTAVR